MRQEPIVYVNGNPMCGRPPNKIGEYAELGDVTAESLEVDEKEFLRVVKSRVKNADGKLDYVDVDKKKLSVEAKDVKTLGAVVESLKGKYPGLVHLRIPICNSASPLEADYDTICSALTGSGVSSPVIVNCQAVFSTLIGRGPNIFMMLLSKQSYMLGHPRWFLMDSWLQCMERIY